MSIKAPLNIIGSPYDLIETFRWILKHIIYDLIYPLILSMFVLLFFELFDIYITLFVICMVTLILGYFIFYLIRSIRNKEENIGTYNDNSNWRVQTFDKMEDKKVIYDIGFVGDIMKMKNYKLKFEASIVNFFKDVDLIVGNLEGIINDKKSINILRQKHRSAILDNLTEITEPPPNWLLCISNNHSADYKDKNFYWTRDFINKKSGFTAFGDKLSQNYSPIEGINIVSGTMWSNFKNKCSSQFRDVNLCYDPNSFNILYPHWHFENECYVRSKIKIKSKNLLTNGVYHTLIKYLPKRLQRTPIKSYRGKSVNSTKWDMIFGHHTHVPQPIIPHQNHLLAYSGGNFTSSKWINKHQHGLILRCQIVKKNNAGSLAIKKIDWSYTKCERDRKGKIVHIDIDVKHNWMNSYDFRVTKIIKNLVAVSLIYFFASFILSYLLSIPLLFMFEVFIRSMFIIGIQFIAVWLISRILFKYKKSESTTSRKE